MEKDCLFCKIIAGEIPSERVFEDAHAYAFLDIHPVNKGHTLVVPKTHAENIYDITSEGFSALMETVRALSPIVKKAVEADGINIGMNNGGAAGQIIFHAHVHIIPRYGDDGFRHWHGAPYEEGEIEKIGEMIRDEQKTPI